MSDKATKAVAIAGLCVVGYVAYQDHMAKTPVQKRKKRRRTPTNPRPRRRGGSNVNFVPILQWGLELMNFGNSSNTTTGTGSGWSGPWSAGSTVEPKKEPATVPSVPSGGGSVGAGTGFQLMADLQRDFGLTRAQAAGIVGNLDHETGGFKFMQEISPVVAGSRGGYGIAQWTGPRRRQFEAWANTRGLQLNGYAANYGFLKHELTATSEKRVIPRLRATSTVEEATRVFCGSSQAGNRWDGFLRPGIVHLSSRISRARKHDGGGAWV